VLGIYYLILFWIGFRFIFNVLYPLSPFNKFNPKKKKIITLGLIQSKISKKILCLVERFFFLSLCGLGWGKLNFSFSHKGE
jgi:hypothetical protein